MQLVVRLVCVRSHHWLAAVGVQAEGQVPHVSEHSMASVSAVRPRAGVSGVGVGVPFKEAAESGCAGDRCGRWQGILML